MQLGTRWDFGGVPPARLPAAMIEAIADVESEFSDGAAEGADPTTWRWTLTWLEGHAEVELDNGIVLRHDPVTDTVTREDPWRDGFEQSGEPQATA
jgi:hypothetical protein